MAAQTTKITNKYLTNCLEPRGSRHFFGTRCSFWFQHLTRQDLGTCFDRVTAPQPLGPSGLRFPWEQYHTGIANWIDSVCEKSNIPVSHKPVRILCKAGSVSARLVFETRAKCQDFVARCKDDGILVKLTVLPAAKKKQLSRFANPNHLKTGRSGSNLRLCGECWTNSSKFSSLMEMTKVHLLSQRSTPAHKFSASRIAATAWEKTVQTVVHSCCT